MKHLLAGFVLGITFLVFVGCNSTDEQQSIVVPESSSITPEDRYSIVFQSVRDAPFTSADYQANYQRYFDLFNMDLAISEFIPISPSGVCQLPNVIMLKAAPYPV